MGFDPLLSDLVFYIDLPAKSKIHPKAIERKTKAQAQLMDGIEYRFSLFSKQLSDVCFFSLEDVDALLKSNEALVKAIVGVKNELRGIVSSDVRRADEIILALSGLEFFYRELIWLIQNLPFSECDARIKFLADHKCFVGHYFSRHAYRYELFKLERVNGLEHRLTQQMLSLELRANFLGYERLLVFLDMEMKRLQALSLEQEGRKISAELTWNGELEEFYEMVSILCSSGKLSLGKLSFEEFFSWLKQCMRFQQEAVLEDLLPAGPIWEGILKQREKYN